jgi:hypothetical protein
MAVHVIPNQNESSTGFFHVMNEIANRKQLEAERLVELGRQTSDAPLLDSMGVKTATKNAFMTDLPPAPQVREESPLAKLAKEIGEGDVAKGVNKLRAVGGSGYYQDKTIDIGRTKEAFAASKNPALAKLGSLSDEDFSAIMDKNSEFQKNYSDKTGGANYLSSSEAEDAIKAAGGIGGVRRIIAQVENTKDFQRGMNVGKIREDLKKYGSYSDDQYSDDDLKAMLDPNNKQLHASIIQEKNIPAMNAAAQLNYEKMLEKAGPKEFTGSYGQQTSQIYNVAYARIREKIAKNDLNGAMEDIDKAGGMLREAAVRWRQQPSENLMNKLYAQIGKGGPGAPKMEPLEIRLSNGRVVSAFIPKGSDPYSEANLKKIAADRGLSVNAVKEADLRLGASNKGQDATDEKLNDTATQNDFEAFVSKREDKEAAAEEYNNKYGTRFAWKPGLIWGGSVAKKDSMRGNRGGKIVKREF